MSLVYESKCWLCNYYFFFLQAEGGKRDLVRSRGRGDVYKRQLHACRFEKNFSCHSLPRKSKYTFRLVPSAILSMISQRSWTCLLYTSDAADERSSVDLGGRRIIKKKKNKITNRKIRKNFFTVHRRDYQKDSKYEQYK